MRMKITVMAVAVALGLGVTGAIAQHDDHHPDQAAPPDKAGAAKMGGMMSQMMTQTMMGQSDTAKLVDQLVKSLAAIETEKDGAVLKTKLAAHTALLKDLQTKVQAQSHRMDMMQHMMGMSGEPKK